MDKLKDGDILRITATDPGFATDAPSWCNVTGNKLLNLETKANKITATIQKGAGTLPDKSAAANDDKTFVVFSNDLDRILAAFVIANLARFVAGFTRNSTAARWRRTNLRNR